jgi:hypothetical protein
MGQQIVVDLALEGEKLSWRWPRGLGHGCLTWTCYLCFILFHGWLGTSEFEGPCYRASQLVWPGGSMYVERASQPVGLYCAETALGHLGIWCAPF